MRRLLWAIGILMVLSVSNHAFAQSPMGSATHGWDRPGQDYRHFSVDDWEACSAQCGSEDKCRAYTFVRPEQSGQKGVCWLKTGVPEKRRNGCCVSGIRIMSAFEHDTDRPGSDLGAGHRSDNPKSCRWDCLKKGNCLSWTWVKPGYQGQNGQCWLKHKVPAKKTNACCVSGVRIGFPSTTQID